MQSAPTIAAPGSLKAWCEMLERYGTLSLADVMEPAIRHASRGFTVTPYLSECIDEVTPRILFSTRSSQVFISTTISRCRRYAAGDTGIRGRCALFRLKAVGALAGPSAGEVVAARMARVGGLLTMTGLRYETIRCQVVRGTYRDVEIVGPPPPSSGGVHIIQMLNLLEGFELYSVYMGFGSPGSLHLILKVLKIAFADRAANGSRSGLRRRYTDGSTAKAYADERRVDIDLANAKRMDRCGASGVAEHHACDDGRRGWQHH